MRVRPKPLRFSGVIAVVFLLSPVRNASATETNEARPERDTVALATSLVTPFFGAYYLEGKLRVSSSFAAILNTSYLTLENDDWKNRAGTVGFGGAYFCQGNAFRGWYVEAIGEVWLSSWRHEPSGAEASLGLGYAGMALAGHQWVFDPGFVLDLGAGALIIHLPGVHAASGSGRVSSEPLTKVYPAAKLNVGWAF